MRLKMRVRLKVVRLMGLIKDTVSLVKMMRAAPALSKAVIRATSHNTGSFPKEELIEFMILPKEVPSRNRAANCLAEITKRITRTKTPTVALKAFMVLHRLLREGGPAYNDHVVHYQTFFNLQDKTGTDKAAAWTVREYARYLEARVAGCKGIGKYLDGVPRSPSNVAAILRDVASLAELLGSVCDFLGVVKEMNYAEDVNRLFIECARLVAADGWRIQEEISVRVEEMKYMKEFKADDGVIITFEALKERHSEFIAVLKESPLRPVIGGRGTVLVGEKLSEQITKLLENLREHTSRHKIKRLELPWRAPQRSSSKTLGAVTVPTDSARTPFRSESFVSLI